MTFWLLLRHEPTVRLVLWMKLNWMFVWTYNSRTVVMLLLSTKSMTMTAQRSKRANEHCVRAHASRDKQIRSHSRECLSLLESQIRFNSFHKWKDVCVYFQWMVHECDAQCVCACVFFSSVFFLSLDKSIFIPTHRTLQVNVNATANTNEKAKENRAGWVGTKIELWYCTLVWLYILYIRISSASFNFTGHIPHHLFTIARSIELAFLLVRYKCLRFACVASILKKRKQS